MPSDNFTGANGTALGTYSANWTVLANAADIAIESNAASCAAIEAAPTNTVLAFWNATTAANDQFSQVELLFTGAAANAMGACVRSDTSGNCYLAAFYPQNGSAYILKITAAGGLQFSVLANDGVTWSSGDTLRLEVSGTTLTVKRNGNFAFSTTDASYASGQYGIGFFNGVDITNSFVDIWSAGDLGAATVDQLYPAYAEFTTNTAMIGKRIL